MMWNTKRHDTHPRVASESFRCLIIEDKAMKCTFGTSEEYGTAPWKQTLAVRSIHCTHAHTCYFTVLQAFQELQCCETHLPHLHRLLAGSIPSNPNGGSAS